MTVYGGLGGCAGGLDLSAFADDVFVQALNKVFGKQMKSSDFFSRKIWSALANVIWQHDNGDTASYSFRAAGDVIASIIGKGDYMDWYCCGPYAVVDDIIKKGMELEGWHPQFY